MATLISYPGVEPINGQWAGKDLITIDQLVAQDVERVYHLAVKRMKDIHDFGRKCDILDGKIVDIIMLEPSTRTLSFTNTAALQLGAKTRIISNIGKCPPEFAGKHIDEVGDDEIKIEGSKQEVGESFRRTLKNLQRGCDIICMRHPLTGAVARVAEICDRVPVINLGDGKGEHPTQGMLDICTVRYHFGSFNGLHGLIIGDSANARTICSLLKILALFPDNRVMIWSPPALRLPEEDVAELKRRGLSIRLIESAEEIPRDCHFWYVVRAQIERLPQHLREQHLLEQHLREYPTITVDFFEKHTNNETVLLHPQPIVDEVADELDDHPRALYDTTQLDMSVYTKMALFPLILDLVPKGW